MDQQTVLKEKGNDSRPIQRTTACVIAAGTHFRRCKILWGNAPFRSTLSKRSVSDAFITKQLSCWPTVDDIAVDWQPSEVPKRWFGQEMVGL